MVSLYIHARVPEHVAQALADGVELFCRANGGELVDVTRPGADRELGRTPPECPACGGQMGWSPQLAAYVCPHDE